MSSNYFNQIDWLKSVTQVAVGLVALIGSSGTAQALNFNFSYAPGTSLEQMLAFEMAGNIWSSYITDNTLCTGQKMREGVATSYRERVS